jgi:ABC-type bacteriocin/lantibiotic exporter with double-glycine peptidase domain
MDTQKKSQMGVLYSLVRHVVRQRPRVVLVTLLGIVSSAIELTAMIALVPLSQLATNQPLGAHSPWRRLPSLLGFDPSVKFYVALFLALLLLRAITAAATALFVAHTFRTLIAYFSARALDAFVRHLSFADVQKESIGHFITLAGDEANRASQIVVGLMKLIPVSALFLLYIVSVFFQSWQFGLIFVVFFAVTALFLQGAFRRSHGLGEKQQRESRALNTHFIESLNGLRTVRGFNAESFVSNRYERMIGNYAWTCFSGDMTNNLARSIPALLLMIAVLAIVIFAVSPGWLTSQLPFLFVGIMMVLRLLPVAGLALDGGLKLTSDLKAAENISEMLAAVQTHAENAHGPLPDLQESISKIDFVDVSFRFSSDAAPVLNHFSTSFRAGRSYAVTGPSGSGKSTLIDLLLKFYPPDSGVIRINGCDIAELSAASLRERMVLVEQTTRVFYDTVLQNVLLGRQGSAAQSEQALRLAGLSEYLASQPQGVNAILNYQGSNLSGGQRQRLGLARGLLRPTEVLILDESTNALDSVIREQVIRNLLEYCREGIVIFVTHDSYVLGCVDEVIHVHAARGDVKLAVAASGGAA